MITFHVMWQTKVTPVQVPHWPVIHCMSPWTLFTQNTESEAHSQILISSTACTCHIVQCRIQSWVSNSFYQKLVTPWAAMWPSTKLTIQGWMHPSACACAHAVNICSNWEIFPVLQTHILIDHSLEIYRVKMGNNIVYFSSYIIFDAVSKPQSSN